MNRSLTNTARWAAFGSALALLLLAPSAFAQAPDSAPPAETTTAGARSGQQAVAPESKGLPRLQSALALLDDPKSRASKLDEAAAQLRKAIEADAQLVDAHYNLVLVLVELGDQGAAAKAAEAMRAKLPNAGHTLSALGYLAAVKGQTSEAEALYKRALDADRTSAMANNYFGAKAVQARDWDTAVRYSRLALVGDPGSINAYANLASAYLETRQLDLAKLVALNALSIEPNSPAMRNLLGLIYLKQDEVRLALAEFNAAISADAKYADARLNAGALTLSYSDFKTALEHFDAILGDVPGHRQAKLSRAVALRGMGKFDDADQVYGQLIEARAGDFEAQYNRCILHNEYMSNYQLALQTCSDLESALSPDHPKKKEMTARVQGIRTTIEALKEE